MTNISNTPARDLEDALRITPREAADAADRYHALKQANYVTSDGDVLTAAEYKRETDQLNAYLKKYLDENQGEPFHVEGVGTLRLQVRSTDVYDITALDDMAFARSRELGALQINAAVMKDAIKRGMITGVRSYPVTTSTALVIDTK